MSEAVNWGPKHDDVFVRPIDVVVSSGGVIVPGHEKNLYGKGEIAAVGSDVARFPERYNGLKVGDRVIYAEEASMAGIVDGVRIARAESVVAIIGAETKFESYRGAGR